MNAAEESLAARARRDPRWRALWGKMLRTDLALFSREMLGLQVGPHMLAWSEDVAKYRRLAVLAARDHSKSTFFSYAYPIWRAWSEPGCEVYLFSATLEQAMEFLDIIVWGRNNLAGIANTPALAHLVPTSVGRRASDGRLTKQDVRLTNGSRIRAIGYGKKIRGRHPKYIVCDDVLNDEDMWSETVRRKHIDYFYSAITNMLTPDGQLVVVGTPYHASDLYGKLRKNPKYTFRRFPGILRDKLGKERALFPWRWSLDGLKSKRTEIGSVAFAREILCQPISDDLSIFPSFLFPPCFDKELTCRMSGPQMRAAGWQVFLGVDIALSASVGADYFVIFVIAKRPDGRHVIVDVKRWRGLSFAQQLFEIEVANAYYQPALVFIESNQMQKVWTQELRRTTDVPVKEFVTLASNKYPLDRGIPSLRILLENQQIVIPRGDAYSRRVTDEWIDEATQFGFVDGKLQGIGEHDDTVLSWWLAEEACKNGGFSFTFGADGDENGANEDVMGAEGADGDDWQAVLLGGSDDGESDAFGI